MAGRTVTRADLYQAVQREVGLAGSESADLVRDVIDEVCTALARGEPVKIPSFGTFAVRHKGERIGRNPKTGEAASVSARRVLAFRPSHILKDRIDDALSRPGD